MCSLIVLLGCHYRGRTFERGVLRKGGGQLSLQDAERGKGSGVVFLAVAHPDLSVGAQSWTNELRLAY